MRESEFARFEEDLSYDALLSARQQRNWLWFGLIISLMLHFALCAYFYKTLFQPIETAFLEPQQTPTFKVKSIDVKALDKATADSLNAAAKPVPDATDMQLPDEKKSFDKLLEEVHASNAMPDDMQNALPDKPKVEPDATSVMSEIERSSAQTLSNSPNATHEQSLLNDSAVSGRPQPALSGTELATSTIIKKPNSFTSKIQADSAGPNKKNAPGFSDLDQLLSQTGPLGSGTQLRMPDDQLFEYNSADLQPSAIAQLEKLGTLIKRNPKATFTIEGYTDSFGPPDYNLELSQRRADGVKAYLVQTMGINPAQIATRGYGQSKFLVRPNPMIAGGSPMDEEAEIRRQQPNRRVVIVVHTDER
jgi:outer membrane protein OmpA-like peptidoglycan-associated protein